MPIHPEELFDLSYVQFFDGIPDVSKIKPGMTGVNMFVYGQLASANPKAKNFTPQRIFADICQHIDDRGLTDLASDSARRLNSDISTVYRWRQTFCRERVLKPTYEPKQFIVPPKVAVRIDLNGNQIRYIRDRSIYTFTNTEAKIAVTNGADDD